MRALTAFILLLCLVHSLANAFPDGSSEKLAASPEVSVSSKPLHSANNYQLLQETASKLHAASAKESATGQPFPTASDLQQLEKAPAKIEGAVSAGLTKPAASAKVSASGKQFPSAEDLKQLEAAIKIPARPPPRSPRRASRFPPPAISSCWFRLLQSFH